jgi:DNA-binding transcriptional regulator YiaG
MSASRRHKSVAPVIERLKAWRETNNLSQAQAVEAMLAAGLPAKLKTLQGWEIGRHSPQPITAAALERFLDQHPTITHPRSPS